ncbi:2-dehydro-3-deoxygluconokinase [Thalassobacillus devorans]|uniref:2-dehydro-3-deoxygluconokinase n=1 Tax=Thalassobacillus devorans TaxID=279813 RepID=A0ABQ1NN14_9BACI|nr:sugar kinase [Thalassobacillus devorans]NIK27148.1 2-dehydro-3-deoxygluconokinase [Thalassobacillus devorans]GGC75326.1 2-dehydro-3-deoxygluconokinase [Thalassobacillus devorans]
MRDVVTIGDAMITFDPSQKGPMRYADAFKRKVGGAEMNFAIGCARLGLATGWISRLGNDEFGRYIYNFVRGEGVDVSSVKLEDGYPTSLNFKEIREDGSGRTFYYRENSPTTTLTIESLDEHVIKTSKVLHITGVFPAIDKEKNVELIEHMLKLAKANEVLVSLDPNIRLKLWNRDVAKEALTRFLPYVDILLTGEDEAELLFDTSLPEEVIKECRKYEITALAIKRGDSGAFGYVDGSSLEVPAIQPKKVVDTVGAGDGFDAGFIYGYLQGWSLEKIIRFANTIGSMVVSVEGDNEGLPLLDEVLMQLGEKELVER